MSLSEIITALDYDFGLALNTADNFTFVNLPTDQLGQLSSSPGIDVIALLGGADIAIDNDEGRTYFGNIGADSLYGNGGEDILLGGRDEDFVLGGAGNDIVSGNLGRDRVGGGDGDDTLFGGQDSDILIGDAGNDQVNGDNGNDILFGGSGIDTLLGGDGNDVLVFDEFDTVINGGAGTNIALTSEQGFFRIVEENIPLLNIGSLIILDVVTESSAFTNDPRTQQFFAQDRNISLEVRLKSLSDPGFDAGIAAIGSSYAVNFLLGTNNRVDTNSPEFANRFFGFSEEEIYSYITSPDRSFSNIFFVTDPSQAYSIPIIPERKGNVQLGTDGDDLIVRNFVGSETGVIVVDGKSGNDIIGSAGSKIFLGGEGNDIMNPTGNGGSLVIGGAGADTLVTVSPYFGGGSESLIIFDSLDIAVSGNPSQFIYDIGITDVRNFNDFFLSGKVVSGIDYIQILTEGETASPQAVSLAESQGATVAYTTNADLSTGLIQAIADAFDNTVTGRNLPSLPLNFPGYELSGYGFSNQDILKNLTATSADLSSIATR